MGSIRLHPQHGVNPSLDICFWTGKPKGVALMGFNKGKEAPRQIVTDYEPGDEAKALMAQGITVVEVVESQIKSWPEIAPGLWPTGRWCVMTDDAVRRLLREDMAAAVLAKRKCFLAKEAYEALGLHTVEAETRL